MIYCKECNKLYVVYKEIHEHTICEETKLINFLEPYSESDFEYDVTVYSESDEDHYYMLPCGHSVERNSDDDYTEIVLIDEEKVFIKSLLLTNDHIDLNKVTVEDAFKLKQLLFPEGGIK